MKMEMPISAAAEFPAPKKAIDITQNFWVRVCAFALAMAVGFLFARLLYATFCVASKLGDGGQDRVSPFVAFWKMLHSGLW